MPKQRQIAQINSVSEEHTAAVTSKKAKKKALQLQKHRVQMVDYRLKKKEMQGFILAEYHQLERVMKKYLNVIQNEVSCNYINQSGIYEILRELIVEKEALRTQNTALYREIRSYQLFRSALSRSSQVVNEEDVPVLPVADEDKGWWVHFSNASPSFYFHPLSSKQIIAASNPLDVEFTDSLPALSMAGTFLGWKIHRHLGRPNDLDKRLLSRVKVSKRVDCTLETAFKVVVVREEDFRPLLKTPKDWNFTKRSEISVQVLQEIDSYTRVMVHDIPGQTSVRYVFLARTAQWELPDGKRRMGFSMMTIDSKTNKRSRDSEIPDKRIEWITESWAYLTLTEIDDSSVEVVYEHCAECETESHAGYLMAQWVQFLVRWEQFVVPSNLVRC